MSKKVGYGHCQNQNSSYTSIVKNKVIFFSFIMVFYGSIFLRVEHWPFTDWGVFTYAYHPADTVVFDLRLLSQSQNSREKFLEEIGFSAVGFNSQISRALYSQNEAELDKILNSIRSSTTFKSFLRNCPCKVQLIRKSLDRIEKDQIYEQKEVIRSYDIF